MSTVICEPYVPPPSVGAVVTVTDPSPRRKVPLDELFVVVKVGDRVNISRLGGHPDQRYWRVPAAWLAVVPLMT